MTFFQRYNDISVLLCYVCLYVFNQNDIDLVAIMCHIFKHFAYKKATKAFSSAEAIQTDFTYYISTFLFQKLRVEL